MKNIIFDVYYSYHTIEIKDFELFNLKIKPLLLENIQPLLNKNVKMRKIMLFLTSDIDSDNIVGFIDNFFNKKPLLGIINLEVSVKNLNWNILNDAQKLTFLLEKWKLLFSNLSDNYFMDSKIEVLRYIDNLLEKN